MESLVAKAVKVPVTSVAIAPSDPNAALRSKPAHRGSGQQVDEPYEDTAHSQARQVELERSGA